MNMTTYTSIWNETSKAFNYLRRKGCVAVASDEVANLDGNPDARLVVYTIGGADDSMVRHVSKTYPHARILYDDLLAVESELTFRKNCLAELTNSL